MRAEDKVVGPRRRQTQRDDGQRRRETLGKADLAVDGVDGLD